MQIPYDSGDRRILPVENVSKKYPGKIPRKIDAERTSFRELVNSNLLIRKVKNTTPFYGGSVNELIHVIQKQISEHLLHVYGRTCNTVPHSNGEITVTPEGEGVEASNNRHSQWCEDGKKSESGKNIDEIIDHASKKYGVDADLIGAVIKAESDFQPESISVKGAMGLMQLMPETAADMGVKNPRDPLENVMGGTRYLKRLLDRYDGDVDRALAAYNWGMGNLERGRKNLPEETRNYIARVNQFYAERTS